jgi:uncharacterized membrane protein
VVGGGYYSTNPARPCALFSAYRWEESTGFTVLGNLTGGFTRADAVSADGRVIVGYEEPPNATASGVKWVDGKQEFIQGPLGPVGFARAVNRDGSIIAGTGCTRDLPNQPPNAFTWTAAGGTKCHTVDPPLWIRWLRGYNYNLYIYAVNDDGRVMGGNVSFNLNAGEEESVIWFDGEPVFLRDYLRSHGYPDAFEGHHSTGRITAISADGRTLVGYNAGVFGTPNRNGFIVVLPELDK